MGEVYMERTPNVNNKPNLPKLEKRNGVIIQPTQKPCPGPPPKQPSRNK